jgi:hypothetical protein
MLSSFGAIWTKKGGVRGDQKFVVETRGGARWGVVICWVLALAGLVPGPARKPIASDLLQQAPFVLPLSHRTTCLLFSFSTVKMNYNPMDSPAPGLPMPVMPSSAQQLQFQYQRIREADQERYDFIEVST